MSDNGSVVAFRSYATDLVEGDLNAVSDVFLFDVPETVVYKFSGFFAPVENLPAVNHVKAGQAVPVKFSLLGNQGLGIFAAGYPRSEQITCGSSILVPGTDGTVTAGAARCATGTACTPTSGKRRSPGRTAVVSSS